MKQSSNETILVVDDDEVLLHLIRIVFERKGYSVLTARDGNEAIDVYSKHKDEVGLVLSDMGLPTLRGQETYKNLKQINPDVKMILGSTYWNSHVRESLKAVRA
ncbi:MAG: response regulator [Nitrososphaera sp.]|nr:response regulator [Nitrososphaera sp.]